MLYTHLCFSCFRAWCLPSLSHLVERGPSSGWACCARRISCIYILASQPPNKGWQLRPVEVWGLRDPFFCSVLFWQVQAAPHSVCCLYSLFFNDLFPLMPLIAGAKGMGTAGCDFPRTASRQHWDTAMPTFPPWSQLWVSSCSCVIVEREFAECLPLSINISTLLCTPE